MKNIINWFGGRERIIKKSFLFVKENATLSEKGDGFVCLLIFRAE